MGSTEVKICDSAAIIELLCLELIAEHTESVMMTGVPMIGVMVEKWLGKTGSKLHPRAKIASQIENTTLPGQCHLCGEEQQRCQGEKPSDIIQVHPPARGSPQRDKCQGPIQN